VEGAAEQTPEPGWGMLCGACCQLRTNCLSGKRELLFVIWMINAQCSAINIQTSIVLGSFETPTLVAVTISRTFVSGEFNAMITTP